MLQAFWSSASFSSFSEPKGIKFMGFMAPSIPPKEPPQCLGRVLTRIFGPHAVPSSQPMPPGHLDLGKHDSFGDFHVQHVIRQTCSAVSRNRVPSAHNMKAPIPPAAAPMPAPMPMKDVLSCPQPLHRTSMINDRKGFYGSGKHVSPSAGSDLQVPPHLKLGAHLLSVWIAPAHTSGSSLVILATAWPP